MIIIIIVIKDINNSNKIIIIIVIKYIQTDKLVASFVSNVVLGIRDFYISSCGVNWKQATMVKMKIMSFFTVTCRRKALTSR